MNRAFKPCCLALGLALALALVPARAELKSGLVPPEALQNIPRAGGECRRDDIVPAQAPLPEGPAPDLTCALPPTEAIKELGRSESLFADLRLASDFDGFHIAASINLRADQLRSKPYWREKRVILVGNGKSERELYSLCTGLKQAGYRHVRVLRGGMPAWLAQELPVDGKAPAVQAQSRLSAAELWAESQYSANLLLLSLQQKGLQPDISYPVTLSRLTPAAIQTTLAQRRKQLKGVGLASVVLAVDAATPEQQLDALRKTLAPVPLLIYADTPAVYRQYVQAQKAMWTAQARGPKQLPCGR